MPTKNGTFSYVSWNYVNALSQGGTINVVGFPNSIKYLFYTTAQIADHFPSNDFSGDNGWGINEPFSNYPPLQEIINSLGPPPSYINVPDIANAAFVYSIRTTAGLFYWFAKEAGLLGDIVVPIDYPTIPQALNAASNGQTVGAGGTHVISSNLNIPSGITLKLYPSSQLSFASSISLSVYGRLIANGSTSQPITFTSTSGTWQGITFNSAHNSSLQYCDITYASSPIVVTNTSNLTISSVTIGNSSFQNYPHDAAMAFYNSSPTISAVIINGQSNSWNGVRFAQGSTGSIQYSTIQNCGAGNGIVVQGNSSPQIWGNIIRNNYFHGIIVVSNGTGNPIIYGNALESNGIVGGSKIYNGINFYSSSGRMEQNSVQNSNYGIYLDTYASGIAGWQGQGNNRVTSNNYGLVAYNSSSASFGTHFPPTTFFNACNKLYGNVTYNAVANTNSQIDAQAAWWGSSPPDPSKIVAVNNSYVNYGYWRP